MCCTWIFTVVSAMSSSRAISLLLSPRAISSQDLALARRQQVQAGVAGHPQRRAGQVRRPTGAGRALPSLTGTFPLSPAGAQAACARTPATSLVIISGLTTDSPSSTLTMESARWSDSTVLSR
jgi:hypothetical protein